MLKRNASINNFLLLLNSVFKSNTHFPKNISQANYIYSQNLNFTFPKCKNTTDITWSVYIMNSVGWMVIIL
jgi:hypothetical protein